MGCIVPPKFICWRPNPQYLRMWLPGDRTIKGITKVQGGYKGGPQPNKFRSSQEQEIRTQTTHRPWDNAMRTQWQGSQLQAKHWSHRRNQTYQTCWLLLDLGLLASRTVRRWDSNFMWFKQPSLWWCDGGLSKLIQKWWFWCGNSHFNSWVFYLTWLTNTANM